MFDRFVVPAMSLERAIVRSFDGATSCWYINGLHSRRARKYSAEPALNERGNLVQSPVDFGFEPLRYRPMAAASSACACFVASANDGCCSALGHENGRMTRPGHRTPLPSASPATIFVPFGLPRLSRVVAPQNAQVSLPDRGKAKGLPCTRCYACWRRRSPMGQRLDTAKALQPA
jgi:hypothetical protein